MFETNEHNELNEQLERLIVRHLDSDLTAEQEHELNLELLRNPAARRMLDAYQQVDSLAVGAIDSVIDPQCDAGVLTESVTTVRPRSSFARRSVRWGLWFFPGAAAAALLAMVIPFPYSNAPVTTITQQSHQPKVLPTMARPFSSARRVGQGSMQSVDWSRPHIERDRGKQVIGVRDAKGNLYWIEVDRTWVVKRPRRPLGEL